MTDFRALLKKLEGDAVGANRKERKANAWREFQSRPEYQEYLKERDEFDERERASQSKRETLEYEKLQAFKEEGSPKQQANKFTRELTKKGYSEEPFANKASSSTGKKYVVSGNLEAGSSKYYHLYIDGEFQGTIRFSDHPMPSGGGYNVNTGDRTQGEAEVSVDPSSKQTWKEAVAKVGALEIANAPISTEISKSIIAKHNFITRSTTEFNAMLAESARTIERRLIAVALKLDTKDGNFVANATNRKRLIIARRELQEAFGEKEYRDATKGLMARADELLAYHKDIADAYGPKAQFAGTSIPSIKILKDAMTREFAGLAIEQSRIIGKQLDLMVMSGQPVTKATKAIAQQLDTKFAPYAKTYAETSLAIYDRLVTADTYPTEADSEYMYAGPLDDLCRDFCRDLVGKVFTYSEIEAMDNGQLPDVFITGGGYNCRHQWLPMPGPDYHSAVVDAMDELKEAA